MTRNISIDQERYMYSKPSLVLNVSKFQKHYEAHRVKALATWNTNLLLKRQLTETSIIQYSFDDSFSCPYVTSWIESVLKSHLKSCNPSNSQRYLIIAFFMNIGSYLMSRIHLLYSLFCFIVLEKAKNLKVALRRMATWRSKTVNHFALLTRFH